MDAKIGFCLIHRLLSYGPLIFRRLDIEVIPDIVKRNNRKAGIVLHDEVILSGSRQPADNYNFSPGLVR